MGGGGGGGATANVREREWGSGSLILNPLSTSYPFVVDSEGRGTTPLKLIVSEVKSESEVK